MNQFEELFESMRPRNTRLLRRPIPGLIYVSGRDLSEQHGLQVPNEPNEHRITEVTSKLVDSLCARHILDTVTAKSSLYLEAQDIKTKEYHIYPLISVIFSDKPSAFYKEGAIVAGERTKMREVFKIPPSWASDTTPVPRLILGSIEVPPDYDTLPLLRDVFQGMPKRAEFLHIGNTKDVP